MKRILGIAAAMTLGAFVFAQTAETTAAPAEETVATAEAATDESVEEETPKQKAAREKAEKKAAEKAEKERKAAEKKAEKERKAAEKKAEKERKKKEKAEAKAKKVPYVSPIEYGQIHFSNTLSEDGPIYYKNDKGFENISGFKDSKGITPPGIFDGDDNFSFHRTVWTDLMQIGIDSKRLKAGLGVAVYATNVCGTVDGDIDTDAEDGKHHWGLSGYIDDWFIDFAPIPEISFALHEAIYPMAAYLPIYNRNMKGGNIGSTGFTFIYRPHYLLDGLQLTVSVPGVLRDSDEYHESIWVNFFNGDDNHGNWSDDFYDEMAQNADPDGEGRFPWMNVGALYDHKLFQMAFSIKNVLRDDNQVGVFLTSKDVFGHLSGFNIHGGLSYSSNIDYIVNYGSGNQVELIPNSDLTTQFNGDFINLSSFGGLLGHKIFFFSATYETELLEFVHELATNCGEAYSVARVWDTKLCNKRYLGAYWDLYTAMSFGIKFTDSLKLTLGGRVMADLEVEDGYGRGSDAKTVDPADILFGFFGGVEWKYHRHSFGIKGDFDRWNNHGMALKVPMYWRYSF